LRWLTVRDGVVLLGDGDGRPDPHPDALFEFAEARGLTVEAPGEGLHSATFGILGVERDGSRLLLRAGEVPARTSAHVHADQLAICWLVDGRRVIDGRGTAAYSGPARDATRSADHQSTVVVPGRSSARFAGPFRLDAHGRGDALPSEPGTLAARCTDTLGQPMHRRLVRLQGPDLLVEDEVTGPGAASARALFHFPDAEVRSVAPGRVEVASPAGRFAVTTDGGLSASPSCWYPTIGVEATACTVAVQLRAGGEGAKGRTSIRRCVAGTDERTVAAGVGQP
jgi:hypothetical protein